MSNFNTLYYKIMHESLNNKILKTINPKKLREELILSYNDYAKKTNNKLMSYKEGEEQLIVKFLETLYKLSIKYENEFMNYDNNEKRLKITLTQDDRTWITFIYDIQLRQPAKLVALRYLDFMGLTIPVEINEAGWPQYKFHMINRFLQLNELYNLFKNNKITEKTYKSVYNLIVDENAKQKIGNEIKRFNNTHKVPFIVEDETVKKISGDVETKPIVNKTLEDKIKNVEKYFKDLKKF